MKLNDLFLNLVEIFRVANDDLIGNTARQVCNLRWKEGLSARNQAHKILDELALTNQIVKGKGFYAAQGYQGEYKEHDRLVTQCIAQLLLLKLPITLYREVSLPIGLRSDLICLIAKGGRATCAIIEISNNETDSYFDQKIKALRNWEQASEYLSQLFKTPVPYFSIVAHGKFHPDVIGFNHFMEDVK